MGSQSREERGVIVADQVDRSLIPLRRPTFGGVFNLSQPSTLGGEVSTPSVSTIPVEHLGATALADVGLGQFIAVELCADAQHEGRTADEPARLEGSSTRCVLDAQSPRKDAHAGEPAEPELVALLASQQVSSPRSTLARS